MENNIEKQEQRAGELKRDNKTIYGYAFIYDVWSQNLGNFKERVARGAISQDFLNNQDVFALLNHNKEKILARSNRGKGTLKLFADERGLRYEFKVKNNALSNEVLQFIEDGELSESSYTFRIKSNQESWQVADNMNYRTINGYYDITDISPVWVGANVNTSCSSRFYIENILSKLPTENLDITIGNKAIIKADIKKIDAMIESDQKRYLQKLKNKYLPEFQTASYKARILQEFEDYKNKNKK